MAARSSPIDRLDDLSRRATWINKSWWSHGWMRVDPTRIYNGYPSGVWNLCSPAILKAPMLAWPLLISNDQNTRQNIRVAWLSSRYRSEALGEERSLVIHHNGRITVFAPPLKAPRTSGYFPRKLRSVSKLSCALYQASLRLETPLEGVRRISNSVRRTL